MRKSALYLFFIMLLNSCQTKLEKNEQGTYSFFIGTYTEILPWVKGYGKGIYDVTIDLNKDTLITNRIIEGLVSPSFLTLSKDGQHIYTTIETGPGKITHIKLNKGKSYTVSQELNITGSSPCHISLSPDGKRYIVSNYSDGSISYGSLNENGDFDSKIYNKKFSGTGPNKERQEGSHMHMAIYTNNGKMIITSDLGSDSIRVLSYQGDTLVQISGTKMDGGDGPRHLALNKANTKLYVINELSNSINTCDFDITTGQIKKLQKINTLPNDYKGFNTTSHIVLSNDGKYLYGGNRGHNSIVAYKIKDDHSLELIGHFDTKGLIPRNFTITKDGAFLICGNQDSGTLSIFGIEKDGRLSLKKQYKTPTPICIVEK